MNMKPFLPYKGELPLDNIVSDGGYCGIFRTVGCIGDSLASGEFETKNEDGTTAYHDIFDYSWGQFMARMAGFTAYNFSRGGMTAREYMTSFASQKGYFDPQLAAHAYIVALGVNDMFWAKPLIEVGSMDDIVDGHPEQNAKTFAGYYGAILQTYQAISPDAKFFLVTIPRSWHKGEMLARAERHQELMYEMAERFENTYVLDIRRYGPDYDHDFHEMFNLGGHMNPMGYLFTAKMFCSYIDYLIRHNPNDFKTVGLTNTEWAPSKQPQK